MDLLDGLGRPDVQPPPARRRKFGEERLADQLMGEKEPVLWPALGHREDQASPFRLFDEVEEGVLWHLFKDLEQLEGEGSPEDGRGRQNSTCPLAEAFEAAPYDKTDTFGHVEPVDVDVGPEAALGVEQPPSSARCLKTSSTKNGLPSVSA